MQIFWEKKKIEPLLIVSDKLLVWLTGYYNYHQFHALCFAWMSLLVVKLSEDYQDWLWIIITITIMELKAAISFMPLFYSLFLLVCCCIAFTGTIIFNMALTLLLLE